MSADRQSTSVLPSSVVASVRQRNSCYMEIYDDIESSKLSVITRDLLFDDIGFPGDVSAQARKSQRCVGFWVIMLIDGGAW